MPAPANEIDMTDVVVIGAGPAGVIAALRAADLGARTTLVTASEFGGMAANDGPVPVRVLAHAARLLRATREVGQYGITVSALRASLGTSRKYAVPLMEWFDQRGVTRRDGDVRFVREPPAGRS
jgi:pyruvate/2-oxoglutarate dehydrogenase complex dihydrolipoamide dehydrogenase (E3) component